MDITPVVLERSNLHLEKINDHCGCTNVLPLLIKHGHAQSYLLSLVFFVLLGKIGGTSYFLAWQYFVHGHSV
jgi:hypothetical protein